jgi:glycosyltransferase involved in cell wall biosynthesis
MAVEQPERNEDNAVVARGPLLHRLRNGLRTLIGAFFSIRLSIKRSGGLRGAATKAIEFYREYGVRGVLRRLHRILRVRGGYDSFLAFEDSARAARLTEAERHLSSAATKPLISVILPAYNSNLIWLREAVDSVLDQVYPHWELCIVDDHSDDEGVRKLMREYASRDPRVRPVFRGSNGHIAAASNSALEISQGEWVAFLDHDDRLHEFALYEVFREIESFPEVGLIYSDEDKLDDQGRRCDPYFKPDWNYDLQLSHNLVTHLAAYRRTTLVEAGALREGFDGAQDYDLVLRVIERIDANQIRHIPRVLYHWRVHEDSTAQMIDSKPYAMDAGQRAIEEHLERRGAPARVESVGYGFRVIYEAPQPPALVSIIICTRNAHELVEACVSSIADRTAYRNYEIIVVDNGSDQPVSLEWLDEAPSRFSSLRVIRDPGDFNFSRLNNFGVAQARGSFVCLMNNDIEVISEHWIEHLLGYASQPGIGAVGPKLLFPNDTVQHAGIILGIGGWAGHAHKGLPDPEAGYLGRASLTSSFSAVTGACLFIEKAKFLSVGGLDEKDLKVACNDVDLCLKLKREGLRNVYVPFVRFYHHESATRGYEDTPEKRARYRREVEIMWDRWPEWMSNDPAYSPNLTLDYEDFGVAWPPRISYSREQTARPSGSER